MMQHEKERLLALLNNETQWCRDAEARDVWGRAVRFDDPTAVAWDLSGAMCLLFGWARALEMFPQVERQLMGRKRLDRDAHVPQKRDPHIASMVAVQEYNDRPETTHDRLMARLESLSVYRREQAV